MWPFKKKTDWRLEPDNLAWERYRSPKLGDWTYTAEKKTENSMCGAHAIRAWATKEEAIKDYEDRCGDMPTLILYQRQRCVERTMRKWEGEQEFTGAKDIECNEWREVERRHDESRVGKAVKFIE